MTITWTPPLAAPGGVSCAPIAGTLPADTYYVKVVAKDRAHIAAGPIVVSPSSAEASITLAAPGGIRATWNAVTGAHSYLVYYRKSAETWFNSTRKATVTGSQIVGLTIDIPADARTTDYYYNTFCEPPGNFPYSIGNDVGQGIVTITGTGTNYTLANIVAAVGNTALCSLLGSGGATEFFLMGSIVMDAASTNLLQCYGSMWVFGVVQGSATGTIKIGDAGFSLGYSGVFNAAKYTCALNLYPNDIVSGMMLIDWGQRHFTIIAQGEKYLQFYGAKIVGCLNAGLKINDNLSGIMLNNIHTSSYQALSPAYNMTDYGYSGAIMLDGAGFNIYNSGANITKATDVTIVGASCAYDMIVYVASASYYSPVRLRNFIVTRTGRANNIPRIYWLGAISIGQITVYMENTFDLTVTVAGVAIDEAAVELKDKNGTLVFSVSTDANGKITQQTVVRVTLTNAYTGSQTDDINFSKSTVVDYNPFTLTVTKEGYQTYQDLITIDRKMDLEIALLALAAGVSNTNLGLVPLGIKQVAI